MDKNIWHTSHEGEELENPINEHNSHIYFQKGIPLKINGERLDSVEIINVLNKIGGENGIGFIDLIENRFVGMKLRGDL